MDDDPNAFQEFSKAMSIEYSKGLKDNNATGQQHFDELLDKYIRTTPSLTRQLSMYRFHALVSLQWVIEQDNRSAAVDGAARRAQAYGFASALDEVRYWEALVYSAKCRGDHVATEQAICAMFQGMQVWEQNYQKAVEEAETIRKHGIEK